MRNCNSGHAYIMVLMVSMLIFLLLSVTLTVTARSRQITMQYQYFGSLYDLAVAGSEKALFILNQAIDQNRYEILYYLPSETAEYFIQAAMPFIDYALSANFSRVLFEYQLHWGKDVSSTGSNTVHDQFFGIVRVIPRSGYFNVQSIMWKYVENQPVLPVEVSATIIWPEMINSLDVYRLKMIELLRIAD